MIILGANIATTFKNMAAANGNENENEKFSVKMKKFLNPIYTLKWVKNRFIRFNNPVALLLNLLMRLTIMPLLGVCMVYLGTEVFGILPRDPILILTVLIEWSTPCAVSIYSNIWN